LRKTKNARRQRHTNEFFICKLPIYSRIVKIAYQVKPNLFYVTFILRYTAPIYLREKILFYLSSSGGVAFSKKKFGLMNRVCVQRLADFRANRSCPFYVQNNTDFLPVNPNGADTGHTGSLNK
jgi:hypothetical protein